MKYKIGDVAKMLGITPEAIRYYESRGIICPDKDENSSYRFYNVWDIHMLIRARSYRQFGYSLSETTKMLNEYTTDEFMDKLTKQESVIESDIIWQINLLKRIRETKQILQGVQSKLDEYSIQMRPAIYRIQTQDAYTILPDAKTRSNFSRWVDKVPFVYPCALFKMQDFIDDQSEGSFSFGLGIDAVYGDFLGLKQTEGIQYFPPITALYTTIKTDSREVLTTKRLKPAMEELKRKGLTLNDDVLSRVVLMRKEGDVYVSYHQLWLPFAVSPLDGDGAKNL